MKLISRDSIANDIYFNVFKYKTVWSLAFKAAEGINFVVGPPSNPNRRIYEKLENNVKEKLRIHGASLAGIFANIDNKRKEINYKNSEELMNEVNRKELLIIFKIMIKGKYYEFEVGH
jgi:hypothetical protein